MSVHWHMQEVSTKYSSFPS